MICRILAWTGLCLAVSVLGAEILVYLETGSYAPLTFAQIWQNLGMSSYVRAEDLIRLRIWPPLWDKGLLPVLGAPAWALLGGLSVFFFLLALRKRR
ncbi:hypothetical protein [Govanella unica]|uniref:Uncharacterized protein n=1 Tax=Govanella unica TaxID=2975056 RepID=A0A9X3TX21_9PROT|nr:hypothetical protein [Govania unica]MDA5192967.1 hypothetical protein [Govania unica]